MIRLLSHQGAPVRAAHVAAVCAASLMLGGGLAASAAQAAGSGAGQTPSVVSDPTLARFIQNVRPDTKGWTSVILQIAPGTSVKDVEKAAAQIGGDVTRHLDIIQSLAIRIPTKNLGALSQTPGVAHISRDVQTTRHGDEFTVQHTGADVAMTPALLGGYGLSGTGVTVAVLDSGIHMGHDFEGTIFSSSGSRIAANVNFVSSGGGTDDKLGHGTHVAGIIAGDGSNSTGLQYYRTFLGVAPYASLVNVRVLDGTGSGKVSDVLAGLNWILQNKTKYKIRVVNISLGHPVYESVTTDPLNLAVQAAWKAGIVVVCSAGNTGRMTDQKGTYTDNEGYGTQYGTIQCPGNDPLVITVGAMKNADANRVNDKIATYSSRGPSRLDMVMKPDIVAPGNRVISVCADGSTLDNAFGGTNDIKLSAYQNTNKNDLSKTYYVLSGTSMAAPVVSGAVALLLNKDSNLSPDTIKARLMLSADKWENSDGTPDVLTYGAGFLNIPAALNSTKVVPSTSYAVSPFLIVANDGTMTVDMNQALWGKASLWETGVTNLQTLWGTDAIIGQSTVWGDQALWGKASAVRADQALWGKATASSVDISSASVYGE